MVAKLDSEQFLVGDREELLRLFSDRFDVAKKQDLRGLFEDSAAYNERLNTLIADWKRDLRYVAERLALWHRRHHRGVIVAIDNTDQLETELQDYAFSLAVEVSKDFACVVLISMREERFYASKIRGMLHSSSVNGSVVTACSQVFRMIFFVAPQMPHSPICRSKPPMPASSRVLWLACCRTGRPTRRIEFPDTRDGMKVLQAFHHFREVEEMVADLVTASGGLMTAKFNTGVDQTLRI